MTSLIEQLLATVSTEATFSLLVETSMKAALLLGVACVTAAVCRRSSAALRHAIWAAGVSAVLALPALAFCLPSWKAVPIGAASRDTDETTTATLLNSAQSSGRDTAPARSTPQDTWRSAQRPGGRPMDSPRSDSQPTTFASDRPLNSADRGTFATSTPDLRRWAVISWFTVASLLALRLTVSWLRVRRLVRRCWAVDDGPIVTEFTAIRDKFRLRRRVACYVAPFATAPLATGILLPRIILPPASREWTREQLRLVLMHELAHIRRHDCLTQLVANLACALFWFNPLVWLASWRMQVERESACDDAVLRHGVAPAHYTEQLFSLATGLEYHRVLAATTLPMARPSRLENRLRAIGNSNQNRRPLSVRQRIAAMCVVVTMTVCTATIRAQNEPQRAKGNDQHAQPMAAIPVDVYGDPLPRGAVARMGTMRLRLTGWNKTIAFADERTLLTASGDKSAIRIWNARSGELVGEINTAPFLPEKVRLLPDGRTLVTFHTGDLAPHQDADRLIQFWDLPMKRLRSIVPVSLDADHDERITVMEITPDSQSVVLGTDSGTIRVLNLASGQELLSQNLGERPLGAIAISPDGGCLATAIDLDGVYFWNWQSGEQPERPAQERAGSAIISLAFTPDGTNLAAAHDSSEGLRIWDVAEKRVRLHVVDGAEKGPRIRNMIFINNGEVLVAPNALSGPGQKSGVMMWNATTGKLIRRFDLGGGVGADAVAVSTDGTLVAAMGDSACAVWEIETGRELSAHLIGHSEPISSISFANRGKHVVTADYAGTVRLWNASNGRQIRMWDHQGWVGAVAVSPNGRWIASSAADIRVWDAQTGEEIHRLTGHQGGSSRKALTFTKDSQHLVSWGSDHLLRTWDMQTGKLISEHNLNPHSWEWKHADPAERPAEPPALISAYESFSLSVAANRFCVAQGAHIHVFDTHSGARVARLPFIGAGRPYSRTLQISPDGAKLLVSTTEDPRVDDQRTIQLIDITSREVEWERDLPNGWSGPTGFSEDGMLAAAAVRSDNGAILVWDVATGNERYRVEGVPEVTWGGRGKKLAISADNTRLAVAMMNATTLIWDISQAK